MATLVLFGVYGAVVAAYLPAGQAHSAGATAAGLTFAMTQIMAVGVVGLHRYDQRFSTTSRFVRLMLSVVLGASVCYLVFDTFPASKVYRDALPDALVLGALGLVAIRLLTTTGLRDRLFLDRVLVLGTGTDAAAVERALRYPVDSGIQLVGFYPIERTDIAMVSGDRVLSDASSLEATVDRLQVQEIIVAVREQRGGQLPLGQLLNCRLRGIRVTDLSAFFERMTGQVPVDSLKASWLIYGGGFRQGRSRQFIKRAFDILAATALLIVSLPVMIATAIAVYMESGRPIVFRQERVGFGGRTFTLLKFRSMTPDAERDGVPRWASMGDSRVTKVGQFIRRSRIDELPQLINVLKGEMSFVGPRPERPYFVSQLAERVPFYGARHTVKPGVTGWAQVHYSYGASVEDAAQKLQFDLYYVKNHTLLLDLLILVRTVRVVLLRQGAR